MTRGVIIYDLVREDVDWHLTDWVTRMLYNMIMYVRALKVETIKGRFKA